MKRPATMESLVLLLARNLAARTGEVETSKCGETGGSKGVSHPTVFNHARVDLWLGGRQRKQRSDLAWTKPSSSRYRAQSRRTVPKARLDALTGASSGRPSRYHLGSLSKDVGMGIGQERV